MYITIYNAGNEAKVPKRLLQKTGPSCLTATLQCRPNVGYSR